MLPPTLYGWCDEYIRHNPLSADAAYRLRRSCRLFIVHSSLLSNAEISSSLLSDWIADLQNRFAPRTCRNHRANVLTVLRFAADRTGNGEIPSRHVRRVNVPPPDPWAWTDGELSSLVGSAKALRGTLKDRPKVPRSCYALSLIGSAYDTGLRKGDLFALDHPDIAADGTIRLRQNKTAHPHLCKLSLHVLALVRQIPYPRPLCWTGKNGDYTALWRELCNAAGVRYGLTQQLRRTAATSVWESNPAMVQQFLGHRTSDMWRYYVDKSRSAKAVAPPPIVMETLAENSSETPLAFYAGTCIMAAEH
jgi:integrase